jgi:preprotein translocase subunit SecD
MKLEHLIIILFVIGCSSQKTIEKHGGLSFEVSISKPEKVEQTLEIINQRLMDFGVYATITSDEIKGNYLIEIPGESDTTLFEKLISSKGKFEILEAYEGADFAHTFRELDEIVIENEMEEFKSTDSTMINIRGSEYSLSYFLMPNYPLNNSPNDPLMATSSIEDTAIINNLLSSDFAKNRFPKGSQFMWGVPFQNDPIIELFLVDKRVGHKVINNSMIDEANAFTDEFDFEVIQVNLKKEFHDHWSRMTRNNRMKYFAITLDNEVLIAPEINSEITNGLFNLSGNFSKREAQLMVAILNSNSLDTEVKINSFTYTPK